MICYMKILFIALFALAGCGMAPRGYGGSPNLVLKAFAGRFAPTDDIFWIEADIDGDGRSDLLVASSSVTVEGSKDRFLWSIYRGDANGNYTALSGTYAMSNDPGTQPVRQDAIVIKKWLCWIGRIPEIKKCGLLHMIASPRACQLMVVTIAASGYTERPVGEAMVAVKSYDRIVKRRFAGAGVPVTHTAKASQLASF